jgi:hypothetical protein
LIPKRNKILIRYKWSEGVETSEIKERMVAEMPIIVCATGKFTYRFKNSKENEQAWSAATI